MMVEQQTYMLSTNDVSWLGGWLFLGMIPFLFFCKEVKGRKEQGSAAH